MKVKELMNYRFSIYECAGASRKQIGECSLYDWIVDYGVRYKNRVDKARTFYKENYDYYKNYYKKYKLPGASMCGVFPTIRDTSAKDIELNGLIVMDIDKYEGDIEELKRKCLEEIDCSFLAARSLSGKGIYVVCHYDKYYDFKMVFKALMKDFKDKIGVEVDKGCSDYTRLRILSFDENIMIKNFETEIKAYDNIIEEKEDTYDNSSRIDREMTKGAYKELVECIGQLVKNGYGTDGFEYYDAEIYDDDNKYDYAKWRRDAWRLGSLDRPDIGKRLFTFISRHAEGYTDDEIVNDLFDRSIKKCPDNNNVGYYFALRDRLRHKT